MPFISRNFRPGPSEQLRYLSYAHMVKYVDTPGSFRRLFVCYLRVVSGSDS